MGVPRLSHDAMGGMVAMPRIEHGLYAAWVADAAYRLRSIRGIPPMPRIDYDLYAGW